MSGRGPDLWVVTTYFNPAGYASKLRNYRESTWRWRAAGLKVLSVECTFGDQARVLADVPDTLHVPAKAKLWQKERLLNLALERLPSDCTKVAWVDADVLFTNSAWAVEAARLLEQVPFVQPFTTSVRLAAGESQDSGAGYRQPGFARLYGEDSNLAASANFDRHGDTGLAWVARRDVLARHGLYDACIAGGADHLMSHAMCGNWSSPCLDQILGDNAAFRSHYRRWADALFADVRGEIACVEGEALHLWHGSIPDRRYNERHERVRSLGYDPSRDLCHGPQGCWEWSGHNPELAAWVETYFPSRHEDVDLAD